MARHFVLTCVLVSALASSARGESHLMRFADIHEDKIVFTYEGDLWMAPSALKSFAQNTGVCLKRSKSAAAF